MMSGRSSCPDETPSLASRSNVRPKSLWLFSRASETFLSYGRVATSRTVNPSSSRIPSGAVRMALRRWLQVAVHQVTSWPRATSTRASDQ